jgi:birA, biotin-[acetyl-CoA-carboxylase] ligase region
MWEIFIPVFPNSVYLILVLLVIVPLICAQNYEKSAKRPNKPRKLCTFATRTERLATKAKDERPMEWHMIHIEETDSTNRWLQNQANHPRDSVVVWTDYQTAGRGCGTNTWESEHGKNLLFSMLIHPTAIPASRQFLISMAISVSIAKVISRYVNNVTIKWPNDIYVGDRKICGILIENRLQGNSIKDSIIGVGLNVNQLRFVSDAPNPVSLANLTGRLFDTEALLHELLETFDAEWEDLEGVRSRYIPLLYRRTGFHRYRDALGEFFAELVTVEDDGHLLLRQIDGSGHRYAFKEVQFVISPIS